MSDCILMPLEQRSGGRRELSGWEAVWMSLGEGEAERLPFGRGSGWKPVGVPRQLSSGEGRQAVWYRTSFPRPDHSGRVLLRIGGAFLATNAWMDGRQMDGEIDLVVSAAGHGGMPAPLRLRREFRIAGGGDHTMTMRLALPGARRWEPWRFGEQPMYRAEMAVEVGGGESARVEESFAFRDLKWDIGSRRWSFEVNGRPRFLRGACYAPAYRLDDLPTDRIAADIRMAKDANIEALRVIANVLPLDFYRLSDA